LDAARNNRSSGISAAVNGSEHIVGANQKLEDDPEKHALGL
jgi:hypothetical protein